MTDKAWQTWRLALHNKQIAIEKFETDFWENYTPESNIEQFEADYATMCEELEAIYAATPEN